MRKAFLNPFSLLLLFLACLAFVVGAVVPDETEQPLFTPLVLLVLWLGGAAVRLAYERGARRTFDRHMTNARNRLVLTMRDGLWIPEEPAALREGDVIRVGAGQRCPVDAVLDAGCRVQISEASLTGESGTHMRQGGQLLRAGSMVIDGTATAQAAAAAPAETYLRQPPPGKTSFTEEARTICLVYARFMLLAAPVAFAVRGVLLGDWAQAALFGLSAAVGLVPEMLPMVTSICLSRGASMLEDRHALVKDVDAMEALGDIDVICMDKTGTLTEDKAVLEYYTDVLGNECDRTLDLVFLENFSRPSCGNQLDDAIRRACSDPNLSITAASLAKAFAPMESNPFDHSAKCSGVKLRASRGALGCLKIPSKGAESVLTVMKGDVEYICDHCTSIDYRGAVAPLESEGRQNVYAVADEMRADGIKVLAVAYAVDGEGWSGLTLCGFLAFFDSPKRSAAPAIEALTHLGVQPKILTGDSIAVAQSVCRRLGISDNRAMTGHQIDALSDAELPKSIKHTALFAELTPFQKMRIVAALRSSGHRVGFLGDGANDLPALQAADLGIVVSTACAEAKEIADIVLLERDLSVVAQGVREGRRTFANISKYVRIASSSNFGNVCSVVLASMVLPFLPATAAQLLGLNLAYDLMCMTIPSDKVDAREISEPHRWSGKGLAGYMLAFGAVSTLFDLLTFALLLLVVCPLACSGSPLFAEAHFVGVFQAGWLLECAWTQSLVILVLRTKHRHGKPAMPGKPLLAAIIAVLVASTALLATPLALLIGVAPVPPWYVAFVAALSALYLFFASLVKRAYVGHGGTMF